MSRNSVSQDIVDFLTAGLVGQGPYYPVEWGKADAGKEVEQQTIIEDSTGLKSMKDEEYENPFFSITVRGKGNETSEDVWIRAVAIHDFLITAIPATINATLYKYFTPVAPLQQMGRDEQGRFMVFAKYFTYRDIA